MDNLASRSIAMYARMLNALLTDIFDRQYLATITSKPLTKTQFTILKLLQMSGSFLSSEIADLMQISRAAASKNIDKLVQLKLVSRNVISKDRRTAKVSLLPAGRNIVIGFEKLYNKRQDSIVAFFNEKERKLLAGLLGKCVHYYISHENNIEFICQSCNGMFSDECALENYNVKCRFQVA